ncbi:MAG: FtsH protease activity modulator HflK, partial [Pseudomonadota bacterium]|nr:FtsH protease activity modulator HflK [Pseudomonadota bacterium]
MAWNEPGGNGKDPWGHRKNEPGPPDLDEVVKKVQDKLGGLFGRKPPKPGNGGSDKFNWSGMGFIVLLLFLIWAAFGFYIIQPAQQGVVTRFGEYNRTTDQGLNWHIPYPIEHVKKVNVQQVNAITHKALMLTQDENLIEIELVVQYRVKNPKNYLFEVLKPDDTLYQATESALREIVGTSKMDQVLTSERSRVAIETKELIQQIINQYQTGLLVISVNMQDAQPPAQVQDVFVTFFIFAGFNHISKSILNLSR